MNLFYLDSNIEKCAQAHIDKHVGKMQLEMCQMLTTAVWIDRLIGFVPDKITSEQNKIIKDFKATQPKIDDRTFTRYLPTHINHPSSVWIRSNKLHFDYTKKLINALNNECLRRGYNSHASCVETNKLFVENMPNREWKDPTLAMPIELQKYDTIESYRLFYMLDKGPIANWKNVSPPDWWDQSKALTKTRYTHLSDDEKKLINI